jgi:hypothetical protein
MLTSAGTRHRSHIFGYLRIKPRMPGFWSPIAFSIPAGVSTILGIGLPRLGVGVMPLLTKAPSRWTSMMPAYSWP